MRGKIKMDIEQKITWAMEHGLSFERALQDINFIEYNKKEIEIESENYALNK